MYKQYVHAYTCIYFKLLQFDIFWRNSGEIPAFEARNKTITRLSRVV